MTTFMVNQRNIVATILREEVNNCYHTTLYVMFNNFEISWCYFVHLYLDLDRYEFCIQTILLVTSVLKFVLLHINYIFNTHTDHCYWYFYLKFIIFIFTHFSMVFNHKTCWYKINENMKYSYYLKITKIQI